ncbi:MAG TPA: EscU/YscU/HrcU family type III secretion system export apparatus switch protein [Clostridia bacterium]|nr:EscU/YscU/HrcU family type III secretion system export apparatus switch protein [Clostridia bacterium]
MEQRDIKKAVVLSYDENDQAPAIVAKGEGYVAQRIIDIAASGGIPLVRSPEQVDALSRVEIGEYIPPELYQAVAEIYAFLMRVDVDIS